MNNWGLLVCALLIAATGMMVLAKMNDARFNLDDIGMYIGVVIYYSWWAFVSLGLVGLLLFGVRQLF